jgi:hypothetical protein
MHQLLRWVNPILRERGADPGAMGPARDRDCIGCCAGSQASCELGEARQQGGPSR